MVCAQFTAGNDAHVKWKLKIDFHFVAMACWLLHFNRVGKSYKMSVKIKRQYFCVFMNVLETNCNACRHK